MRGSIVHLVSTVGYIFCVFPAPKSVFSWVGWGCGDVDMMSVAPSRVDGWVCREYRDTCILFMELYVFFSDLLVFFIVKIRKQRKNNKKNLNIHPLPPSTEHRRRCVRLRYSTSEVSVGVTIQGM
jgi:hypothetical protein